MRKRRGLLLHSIVFLHAVFGHGVLLHGVVLAHLVLGEGGSARLSEMAAAEIPSAMRVLMVIGWSFL